MEGVRELKVLAAFELGELAMHAMQTTNLRKTTNKAIHDIDPEARDTPHMDDPTHLALIESLKEKHRFPDQAQIIKNVKEQLVNIQKTVPGGQMDTYIERQKESDVIQNFAANNEGNMEALMDEISDWQALVTGFTSLDNVVLLTIHDFASNTSPMPTVAPQSREKRSESPYRETR
ncbi:hypothetical protein BGZ61DRAFT_540204 [Ilyonectria robusta]|uniref:uncharacterized protein n=1 Tax=Ilyonectria robusta TaxID=1079257 RepID=UPI001E8D7718|nr:uncharacterized protein BGZ61DRAFT_540204 [Ilyonectria robusta]KAH8659646.1 hypothetical protein BGZ61DRAFT_540204 [Ilyonectria robusta]